LKRERKINGKKKARFLGFHIVLLVLPSLAMVEQD
jgi:hypothetical protein